MDGRLEKQEESMRAESLDSFEMERREELVKKVKCTASVFYKEDSETFKLVESLARETPLLSVWAERASGSELVQSIKRVRPSLTEEKAHEVAACFLPYSAQEKKEVHLHTRLATRASRRRSNEYMQYNSAHSEQDKGACVKASPFDPTLPKYTQVHMWKKDVWDEVMSMDTGREGTMQALIRRAESSGCAFEFRFTGEKPSVGIYKPDVIMIAKGRPLSMLKAFAVLLNVDSTTEGSYDSDAKVGHVITYAQEFLKLVGPVRNSVVVGVTNFVMVRFFRVMRADDDEPLLAPNNLNGFIIKRDEPTSDVIQVLSAYLQAKPASLDVNININSWECLLPSGWTLRHYLGKGRTSIVYLAIGDDDRKYAVKVSRPGYNVDNDFSCLDKLEGIDGIPRVHLPISSSVLVLQPVGKPFTRENFYNNRNVLALGDLVDVLEAAHERKILHRDIRVDNIMIAASLNNGQQRLFLLDWGYAARCDAIGDFSGSVITASDHVLSQLVIGNTNRIVYTCADDLICLVRCLFLFTCQQTSSSLYENADNPEWILQFWKRALEGKGFWEKVQAYALEMNYAMLKEWLLVLQDTIGD